MSSRVWRIVGSAALANVLRARAVLNLGSPILPYLTLIIILTNLKRLLLLQLFRVLLILKISPM